MKVRGVFRFSWMTVLCLPPLPELASFVSKSARAFCSLGTCINSNTAKRPSESLWHDILLLLSPVTRRESLFANKLCAPISLANSILAIRASYSAWLLLALKANRRACSINSPFGPSRMMPASLPCWLEEPSTESTSGSRALRGACLARRALPRSQRK